MTLEGGLLLLLALGLGLAGAQKALDEVPVQPGFDPQKVEGRWFTVQLASSHAHLVSPEDPLKLSLHSIRTRDGGDVEFMLFWKGEGACEGINVTVHPTGLQGQYLGSFEGGRMHVRFASTDYTNLILYVRFEDDVVTSLWVLLARSLPGDPAWLQRFQERVEHFRLHRAPVSNTADSLVCTGRNAHEEQGWRPEAGATWFSCL
ncbi:uterocalin-like isoform X7 [Heterocephalus glaber]|uniref:Uterocalin-like isoform X7 n=1 Tax=Heterocephalus glaber TaxID=10181 RepID=A0AAX6TB61_HETGA|nr:uterocalin-like isoform X7 [Heterocephalus glaber]